MFYRFDHEIVLEGMKEEISQQRCTIGAHWYTNNLPEKRASKTNIDVVDKKVAYEHWQWQWQWHWQWLTSRTVCELHIIRETSDVYTSPRPVQFS